MKICLNGTLVDHEQVRIDPADRGFTLGDGVFETIALRKGRPKRVAVHLARLRTSAAFLGIPLLYIDNRLQALIAETAAANALTDAAVRVTLTRGPGPRGLAPPLVTTPTLMITTGEMPPEPEPAKVIVATVTRRNEHSPLARLKTLNALDNVLAKNEATKAGADDAILLNTQGRVAESTIANIFVLVDGFILTPPPTEGVLPGVMRGEIIRLTRAEERPITLDLLNRASEVFLTNALGIRPVIAIDSVPVGDGEAGLITQLLATRV